MPLLPPPTPIESSEGEKPSMMTTAGGDGLSFMIGQPNIFEIIEALKDGKDLLEGPSETQVDEEEDQQMESLATEETTEDDQEEDTTPPPSKPYNDFELMTLEELPDELSPISTIIEIV